MAQCIICENKGLFLKVDANKLCNYCKNRWRTDIKNRLKLIKENWDMINSTANLNTKISRCDSVIKNIAFLHQTYEVKGLFKVESQTKKMYNEASKIRIYAISEYIKERLEKMIDKIEKANTDQTKKKYKEQLTVIIDEFKEKYPQELNYKQVEAWLEEIKKDVEQIDDKSGMSLH